MARTTDHDDPTLAAPGRPPQRDAPKPPVARPRDGKPTQRDDSTNPTYEGSGVAAGVIGLLVAATLIVIVVGQNTDDVAFDFLWWGADIPLAVLLLATALVVIAVDQVVGLVWRRRRRKFRQMSDAT